MQFKNLSKKIEKVEYEALNGHFYDTQEEAEQASKVYLISEDITNNISCGYEGYSATEIVEFLIQHYNIEPKGKSKADGQDH